MCSTLDVLKIYAAIAGGGKECSAERDLPDLPASKIDATGELTKIYFV